MQRSGLLAGLATTLVTLISSPSKPQTLPNPAMNSPDQLSWQLFIQVNSRAPGNNNAVFETWASDTDTFKLNPQFPSGGPAIVSLREPVVPTRGREAMRRGNNALPVVAPFPGGEETRRNRAAFDFIVKNNLYKVSGLKATVGKRLSFPVDAIEVKANWLPVQQVPGWTLGRVSPAQVSAQFHVNIGSDGKQYALVAMHIISKLVPNWTWATFEHQFNPERCDIIGCMDSFGAQDQHVKPNADAERGYSACAKTPALKSMITAATWDRAFENYCLKGSQVDFVTNNGLDTRLGNSVTEKGFVDRSSCMTCHGRAAWDANGHASSDAGFDPDGAPLGPLQPNWFWSFTAQPPIFENMNGLAPTATSADFVWSIPFCAVDDTVNPPLTPCAGK